MQEIKFITQTKRGMNYLLFKPNSFREKPPLIVYLHGAGERGKNIGHIAKHALPRLLREGLEIDAVV